MAITAVRYEQSQDLASLASTVTSLLASSWKPLGPVTEVNGNYVQTLYQGTEPSSIEDLSTAIEALQTDMTAAQADITAAQADVTRIDNNGATLIAKINTDATAQNALSAFPLTLDTNYAWPTS